jgi:nitrous oxidase accessory protein NosD
MADQKIIDVSYQVPKKRGNGLVRHEVWADQRGQVTHYNLAYIHHGVFQRDNGRAVGYDNAHGEHHRHYLGTVETIIYTNFHDVQERFLRDWTALASKE